MQNCIFNIVNEQFANRENTKKNGQRTKVESRFCIDKNRIIRRER
jgi:hypothetical protein